MEEHDVFDAQKAVSRRQMLRAAAGSVTIDLGADRVVLLAAVS